MLKFLTAGESHGKALMGIVDGYPAGVRINIDDINYELKRRQIGYGRGKRMQIEEDRVEIISGVNDGLTFGAPISFLIINKDYTLPNLPEIKFPRPGHADLAGGMKYNFRNLRLALERASARETAARTVIGALCKQFLKVFKISVFSHVIQIGNVKIDKSASLEKIPQMAEKSDLRCIDRNTEKKMKNLIDNARKKGDSLGGVFEVVATGVPPGLGSYVQWDRRLDGLIAHVILSIPGVKAVEIGEGIKNASLYGSQVQDEIFYSSKKGYYRRTNNAGGLEAGMTNGMPVIVRGYMKPIATLSKPLSSVDIDSKRRKQAVKERADITAVPSAGVVAEAMLAYIIMNAFLEKFGADCLSDIKNNYKNYISRLQKY